MRWILLVLSISLSSSLLSVENRKVLCVTVPKSGSHLLKKALEMIQGCEATWIYGESFKDEKALKQSDKKLYIAHIFPETELARFFDSKDFAKVVLIRDPRDVMLSFLHHVLHKKTWSYDSQFDHEKFSHLSLDQQLRETLLFPYPSPIHSFPYAIAWMSDPSVFVCRFEDLVGAQGGGSAAAQKKTLLALASFIGSPISPERAEEIGATIFGNTWTFRKGQIGQWKEAYTPDTTSLFKRVAKGMVVDFGYGADENW